MTKRSSQEPFQQVLAALLDLNAPFSPTHLHRFSDLEGAELAAFKSIWPKVNTTRRLSLLEDLEELSEIDTVVLFDTVARVALDDVEPTVRSAAIRLLWECTDKSLIPVYIQFMEHDSSADVRATAASVLGNYIYLGELEELPAKFLHNIEEHLLAVAQGEDEGLVRRRAIEALGYSSRGEVHDLIQKAYDNHDPDWTASALLAMGRSYDKSWEQSVRRMLQDPHANVQLEAVRAAGELELESARRGLLDLLDEEAQDSETRLAAIWSLSQIGGEGVREKLEEILDETEDEEESELVDNAIDNLTLTETGQSLTMFNIDFQDEEHLGKIIDLEKPDSDDDLESDELAGDEEEEDE
jgi:HEAT repeat protein